MTFITLKPELVEKKDPPNITSNKNIKDRLRGISEKEIPIFETLLHIETKIVKNLLSKLKKIKKKTIIIIKYNNIFKSSLK